MTSNKLNNYFQVTVFFAEEFGITLAGAVFPANM